MESKCQILLSCCMPCGVSCLKSTLTFSTDLFTFKLIYYSVSSSTNQLTFLLCGMTHGRVLMTYAIFQRCLFKTAIPTFLPVQIWLFIYLNFLHQLYIVAYCARMANIHTSAMKMVILHYGLSK